MLNRDPKGFTLIELMLVVAIIGILAAVAIPAYSYFIKASKTSDGLEKVKSIADGAVMYYNTSHHFSANGLVKKTHIYPGCQNNNAAFSACALANNFVCPNKKAALTTPADLAGAPYPQIGTKGQIAEASFAAQPWQRLGFQVGGPTYYCFSYMSKMSQHTGAVPEGETVAPVINDGYVFTAAAAGSLQKEGDSWVYITGHPDGTVSSLFRNE